jgi:hypothetical protein
MNRAHGGAPWSTQPSSMPSQGFDHDSLKFDFQGLLYIGILASNRRRSEILSILSLNKITYVRFGKKSERGRFSLV